MAAVSTIAGGAGANSVSGPAQPREAITQVMRVQKTVRIAVLPNDTQRLIYQFLSDKDVAIIIASMRPTCWNADSPFQTSYNIFRIYDRLEDLVLARKRCMALHRILCDRVKKLIMPLPRETADYVLRWAAGIKEEIVPRLFRLMKEEDGIAARFLYSIGNSPMFYLKPIDYSKNPDLSKICDALGLDREERPRTLMILALYVALRSGRTKCAEALLDDPYNHYSTKEKELICKLALRFAIFSGKGESVSAILNSTLFKLSNKAYVLSEALPLAAFKKMPLSCIKELLQALPIYETINILREAFYITQNEETRALIKERDPYNAIETCKLNTYGTWANKYFWMSDRFSEASLPCDPLIQ